MTFYAGIIATFSHHFSEASGDTLTGFDDFRSILYAVDTDNVESMSNSSASLIERTAINFQTKDFEAVPWGWRALHTIACCIRAHFFIMHGFHPSRLVESEKNYISSPFFTSHEPPLRPFHLSQVLAIYWLDLAVIVAAAPILRESIQSQVIKCREVIPVSILFDSPLSPCRDAIRARTLPTSSQPMQLQNCEEFVVNLKSASPKPLLTFCCNELWRVEEWQDLNALVRAIGCYRVVPVEVGGDYTESTWTQKFMCMGEFVRKYLHCQTEGIGYVAQFELLNSVDIDWHLPTPDLVYFHPAPQFPHPKVHFWIGPKGTVTPYHTDPYDNLFCQVVGWKRVDLQAPGWNHRGSLFYKNTVIVDKESVDLRTPPISCILGPGNAVFIPRGWWHYVEAISDSMSISYWN